MWSPLAAAQIIEILVGIWRDLRGDKEMKVPTISEALKWIALPLMAEAVEEDEKEREALAMFNAVKRLKEATSRKAAQAESRP